MQKIISIILKKLKISVCFILLAVSLVIFTSCGYGIDYGGGNPFTPEKDDSLVSANKDNNGIYIRTTWVDIISDSQNGKNTFSDLLNQLANDKITRLYLRLGDIETTENNDGFCFKFLNEPSVLTQDSISLSSQRENALKDFVSFVNNYSGGQNNFKIIAVIGSGEMYHLFSYKDSAKDEINNLIASLSCTLIA